MSEINRAIEDQALDWIIRQADPQFDAWEGFHAWLGSDPRHATVYQAMAVADSDTAASLSAVPSVAVQAALRRSWVRWPVAAIAAAGIAVFGYSLQHRQTDLYAIETVAGQHRTVTLVDGSRVTLDGNTRVVADRDDPRRVSLERGEAVFAVFHDEARPFTVAVGGATLVDVGTVFAVTREGRRTSVEVVEGAVIYNPKGEKVRLDAGMTLRADDGAVSVVVGRTDPATIAGWRTGQLVYYGASLSEVVADVARASGLALDLAPALSNRPFQGVIVLDGGDEAIVRRLRVLLAIDIERRGDRWKMTAKGK
jgi:transmembrane sensor